MGSPYFNAASDKSRKHCQDGSLWITAANTAHRLQCWWHYSGVKWVVLLSTCHMCALFVVLRLHLGLLPVLRLEIRLGCLYWRTGPGRMPILHPTGRMGWSSCTIYKALFKNLYFSKNKVHFCSAHIVLWLDHSDAMCSRAWRTLCAIGSRFNSSRGPGKAHLPM